MPPRYQMPPGQATQTSPSITRGTTAISRFPGIIMPGALILTTANEITVGRTRIRAKRPCSCLSNGAGNRRPERRICDRGYDSEG
jgi:hypothetical protein